MPFRFNPFTDRLDLTETGALPPGGGIQTITGNTGGAVGPNLSNNVNLLGSGAISVTGNPVTNTLTISLSGSVATTYTANTGSATPSANNLNIFGAVVAAGTTPFASTASGSTVTLNAQISQAIAASNATNIGISAFNSAHFSVDANGFVSLLGGGQAIDSIQVDANTAPGTNPVLPTVAGLITVTGGQVAAGVIGANVIRTDSLAANTYTIEIQRSAAVVSSNSINNGVSHFNSAQFTVDANAFVSLNGGAVGQTITGNSGGALSPTAGNWNIFGASVAAGSTPVATSGAVSTLTVNVQISQAIASTNASNVGLAAFNSAQFSVDANGFVSSNGAGFQWIDQGTSTTGAVNKGYFVTAAVTLTLPAAPAQGDVVKIICDTTSTVVVTANTGQTIRQGNLVSSSAGTFTNSLRGDALELIYRAATTQWIALNGNGVWVAA